MCVRARQRHPRHNIFFRRGSGLGSFIPSVQCLDCSSALASELGEFGLFSDIKFRELIELRFAVVLPTNHHYEYRLLTFSAKAGSGACDCSSSKEAYANLRKFFLPVQQPHRSALNYGDEDGSGSAGTSAAGLFFINSSRAMRYTIKRVRVAASRSRYDLSMPTCVT